ncbi:hypothetical protein SAMN05192553_102107 [Cyclobacterium xiamenense]|uniref:Uncharacterized protein n=1 Tax=Cyclobacterium xiamenense TaxID=1297121 RepID=A0A1H6VWG2_9BACT|nr:hypothetical protein [Cyclobacterium xiamenense]SEJ04542.1 hypothetical protein SAMN05192553_102107 [Cyclobacterium xiamenense]
MKSNKRHIIKIKEIEKKHDFIAPKGYFENFQNELFDKIDKQIELDSNYPKNNKKEKTFRFVSYYSIAASIVLLLLSIFAYNQWEKVNSTNLTDHGALLSQVTDEEIIRYLQFSNISYEVIASSMDEDQFFEKNEHNFKLEIEDSDEAEALLEYYSL